MLVGYMQLDKLLPATEGKTDNKTEGDAKGGSVILDKEKA